MSDFFCWSNRGRLRRSAAMDLCDGCIICGAAAVVVLACFFCKAFQYLWRVLRALGYEG